MSNSDSTDEALKKLADGIAPLDPVNVQENAEVEETKKINGEMLLSIEQRRAKWLSKRPDISHLKNGIVQTPEGPLPLFNVNDRIVVDRRTSLLEDKMWLETIVGTVKSIDDDKGIVMMTDEEADQRQRVRRFVSFKDGMHDIRIAPKGRGNPFVCKGTK